MTVQAHSSSQHSVLILVDYRGAFWSSTRNTNTLCTLDVHRLQDALRTLGHEVEVLNFSGLDLSRRDLAGRIVLYTSSEDEGAHYKRYIEGKIFGLRMAGALPVPQPELLLAHHDKAMMESIRQVLLRDLPGQLRSYSFGTFEDAAAEANRPVWPSEPMVVKPASGAGSRGVHLVEGRTQGLRVARSLSRSLYPREMVLEFSKRLRRPEYVQRSLYRRPIVLQQFLPDLTGDFKVLRYGSRFYVVRRSNRPGDFRASGSGLLHYEPAESAKVVPVLDAAALWSDALGSPFCSLDVAYDSDKHASPILIEFQCVNFGPAAAENSTGYYERVKGVWHRFVETCDLETVIASAALISSRSGILPGPGQ